VRVEFAEDSGVPLSEMVGNLEDVLEVLDFALFLSHGDAQRWLNEGGRGQVRLSRLTYGSPVVMEMQLVMSGGLGLTHADVLTGVTAAGAMVLTASNIRKDAGGTPAEPAAADESSAETETVRARIEREDDEDAAKRVRDAMERVAYSARGTDLAWRIREAEEHITTSPDGTPAKGQRFVRAAGRLTRKDDLDFRVER
jgi:hypothetical protein